MTAEEIKNLPTDWNKADDEGNIHVPDVLDPLVNKIAFQFNLVNFSGKSQNQAICDIALAAQKFFTP